MSQSKSNSPNSPDTLMCILSYLGVFSLIPYFVRKNDPYILWHAKQGVLLTIVCFVISFALAILSCLPGIGIIAWMASLLFGFGILALSIYCMIQACNGKQWKIPVLGEFISKIP